MTVPVDEFLRRILLHLLPRGFVRIRNFGFLANRRRDELLTLLPLAPGRTRDTSFDEIACSGSSSLTLDYPVCGGTMHVVERLAAAQLWLRSPPQPDRCTA